MNTYCVYLAPDGQADKDNSTAKFLVDGKSLFAVLLPPIWLLWNRMWWGFGIYIALLAIISLLVLTPWRDAAIFLSAIPGLYLFLEGHELVCQQYERKGWSFVGVVHGRDMEEAELRYFEILRSDMASAPSAPITSAKPVKFNPQKLKPRPIGLFPLDGTA